MDSYDESYERAEKKVKKIKLFYRQIISFISVNILLFVINYFVSYGNWWFLIVTIIWGISIIIQYIRNFVLEEKLFEKEWEEKKIDEYMENEKKINNN